MVKDHVKLFGIIAVFVLAVILSVVATKHAQAPSEQSIKSAPATPGQTNEQSQADQEGATSVEPNVHTQEYRLTAANVSCSTSTMNGQTSRSCSGNIRVVPSGQTDMDPGMYKINEQTKLLHDGVEQDLNSLQQLAQNNTVVKLKLVDGSGEYLAEITY